MLRALSAIAGLLIAGSAAQADAPKVTDLVRQLETGGAGERVIAAERLGDLGSAAADAIPALTRVARNARRGSLEGDAESRRANKHLYDACLDALTGIGPKSVPALVELLPGEKDDNFGSVARHIHSFGREAVPSVPALAKLLADDNQDFRVRVAYLLEEIGPGAEPAIPELVGLFLNPKNENDNRKSSGPLPPPPRVAAVRALLRIGPKGTKAVQEKVLPVLAKELKTGESASGGSTEEVLSVLGESGASIVPEVIAAIKNGELKFGREGAGTALLGLGVTGRQAFGKLIAGPDIEMRKEMHEVLRRYLLNEHFPTYDPFDTSPLDLTPFVPALAAMLKEGEPRQRIEVARTLSDRADKVPREVVDTIIGLFRDPAIKKWMDQEEGAWLSAPNLNSFGEVGTRALVPLLDSDSAGVREAVIDQLGHRKWSAGALPSLRKLAEASDSQSALTAAFCAAALSLDPKDAARLADRRFLRNDDPKVREYAADYLGHLDSLGAPHHEALIPLLEDKDKVAQSAARTIYDHAPKGSAAARAFTDRNLVNDHNSGRIVRVPERQPEQLPGVPDLIASATTERDEWKRAKFVLDLGDRGTAAKEAVPALKKLLTDPDPALRFAAGIALAQIENDQPALRKLLTAELERAARGRPVAWIATEALERLPPDFPELIPLIIRWLEHRNDDIRFLSIFRKYGPKAKAAVPAIHTILRGPKVPNHHYFGTELKPACEALAAIGPDAREALPELQRRFDTGSIEVALAAREAIRKITGEK
ncbi:HEAT repeat domain-containing protein [Gemmata sp. G18]|uniref:HEAT repeat domain-containing protein n=1 Tax=Gemmata palustris TaxID=2822762 RepID=A0ABS5BLH8_9BACT|nr:HEAT repeat domain-containing protein [Gemmata palustris]MBP3954557.1 HEAT repeat domain-containing protein [Gemmata palustris]